MPAPSSSALSSRTTLLRASRTGALLLAVAVLTGLALVPDRGQGPAPATSASGDTPVAAAPVAAAAAVPGRLLFSTYLGGEEWDEASAVATDEQGNIVVAGFTLSADFPVAGAAARRFAGIVDAFVVKISADRRRVLWSTLLGGVDLDVANAVAVDRRGNVYVTGRTGSPDFPVAGALQPTLRASACTGEPCHDAFVTKLDPNGAIVYSTYFGGTRNEEGQGIAVDDDGNAYVTGNTDSLDLPTRNPLQGTFQSLPCEGDLPCPYDVFVTKLDASGRTIVYSTYLGGDATDISGGIAVDSSDRAHVTGSTRSPDFPTAAALQPALRGRACGPPPGVPCTDVFVTALSATGNALAFSTLLGGTKSEASGGIAVADDGSTVVTGSTQSVDFPTARPAQPALDNAACTEEQPEELCNDGFVSKLSRDGRALAFSTYLGGRAEDQGLGVTVDDDGNAHVAGSTDSRNFPTRAPTQAAHGGYIDGFVTTFTPAGAIAFSTFLGGSQADRSTAVAVDARGLVQAVGRTLSPDFPTVVPLQPVLRDADYDAFVTTLG